jgi:uncharacterized CHY-type Zn-finger protein
VVIIHFHSTLHQIINCLPLQLLFKAVPIFQWIWKSMARSANRPVTLFNAVTLHGKFTFNSLTFIIFCNFFLTVMATLATTKTCNNRQQQVQRHLPICGRCSSQYTNQGYNSVSQSQLCVLCFILSMTYTCHINIHRGLQTLEVYVIIIIV